MKIKPQFGITYECYIGFTDFMGSRARRGQRVYLLGEFREYYYMLPTSMKGYGKAVSKEKFASHFVPVNPLNCCDE
jgi:hypothetical protein